MPYVASCLDNELLITNYLTDIKEVVVKKDVTNRNNVKDPFFLDNLINYMASNIGNLTTANNIHNFLKNNKSSISYDTIDSYLKMLGNAFLLYRVPRYELKGKQLLKTQGKYYFVDTGLKNIVNGFTSYKSDSSYENLVFVELLRRGYNVYIGKFNELEIDFVAVKPTVTKYIQVIRSLEDENVLNREKKSLLTIKDNYEKIIVTADEDYESQVDGIKIINIIDFLEDESI